MDTKTIAPSDFETGRIIINNNLVGGKLSAGAPGEIPFQASSGNTQFIPVGVPGQVLVSNGTNAPSWVDQNTLIVGNTFHILAPPPKYTAYSTPGSGTHNLTAGCLYFEVWATGGGGGGGNGDLFHGGNGGGGGGTGYGYFTSFVSTSYLYTVGTGGLQGQNGTNSNFSNVGSTIIVSGLGDLKGDNIAATGGGGGSFAVFGATHSSGFKGGDGFYVFDGVNSIIANHGGASHWTGSGRTDGSKGSGGGGAQLNGSGQEGGNGYILIKEHFY